MFFQEDHKISKFITNFRPYWLAMILAPIILDTFGNLLLEAFEVANTRVCYVSSADFPTKDCTLWTYFIELKQQLGGRFGLLSKAFSFLIWGAIIHLALFLTLLGSYATQGGKSGKTERYWFGMFWVLIGASCYVIERIFEVISLGKIFGFPLLVMGFLLAKFLIEKDEARKVSNKDLFSSIFLIIFFHFIFLRI